MQFLIETLGLTARDPRKGMRRILDLNLPPAAAMAALALMAVASAMLIHLGIAMMPEEEARIASHLFGSPFVTAGLQFGALLFAVLLIWLVGRQRGGTGDFNGSVLVMVWLQVVMMVLQIAQLVVSAVAPPVGMLFGYLSIGVFLICLAHFIAEMHRFRSVGMTFLGIVVTVFAAVLVLSFLLSFFIDPETLRHGL